MNKRKREEDRYLNFLQEPEREKEFRDKVLKPGVVHPIHLSRQSKTTIEWADIQNKPALYTQAEIDALLAARDELSELLDVSISSPVRHNFLMYDESTDKWINNLLDMDFEDSIEFTCTNIFQALAALIRIEDSLTGDTIIVEDSL